MENLSLVNSAPSNVHYLVLPELQLHKILLYKFIVYVLYVRTVDSRCKLSPERPSPAALGSAHRNPMRRQFLDKPISICKIKISFITIYTPVEMVLEY